jgi:hypothetical protein
MTERGLTVQRYHVVAVDGGVAHGRDRVCVVVGVETLPVPAVVVGFASPMNPPDRNEVSVRPRVSGSSLPPRRARHHPVTRRGNAGVRCPT